MSESNVTFSDAEALEFHARGRPGKIEIIASKPMATQRDLSLAYSPGVAVPVRAIAENPTCAYDFTAKRLKSTALPSITGLEASAPRLPRPRIAVPFEITATMFERVV